MATSLFYSHDLSSERCEGIKEKIIIKGHFSGLTNKLDPLMIKSILFIFTKETAKLDDRAQCE